MSNTIHDSESRITISMNTPGSTPVDSHNIERKHRYSTQAKGVPTITDTSLYTNYSDDNSRLLSKFGSLLPLTHTTLPKLEPQTNSINLDDLMFTSPAPRPPTQKRIPAQAIISTDTKLLSVPEAKKAITLPSNISSDFMRAISITNTNNHTHVTFYEPHANWTVPPANLGQFWLNYCNLVDKSINGRDGESPDPFADICIGERPQEIMPIIFDLNFKFPEGDNEHFDDSYNGVFLREICYLCQIVIQEYFIVSPEPVELITVVLESNSRWYEKDPNNGETYICWKTRLQFPYAKIKASLLNQKIRPRLIQLLRSKGTINKISKRPIGDWEQIISPNTMNGPIIMYGSSDTKGLSKLRLKYIWPLINENDVDNDILSLDLPDLFHTHNHNDVQRKYINNEIFLEKDIFYWLPMFLSVGYWSSQPISLKNIINDDGRFTTQKTLNLNVRNPLDIDKIEPQNIQIGNPSVTRLLKIFTEQNLPDEWFLFHGETQELRDDVFVNFSADQSSIIFKDSNPDYVSTQLQKHLNTILISRYQQALNTKNTKDKSDAEKLAEVTTDGICPHITIATSCIEDDVTNMILHYESNNIRCTDIKHKVTWLWNDNLKLWVESCDELIINFIMVKIRPLVSDAIRTIISAPDRDSDRKFILRKKLTSLYSKLGTVSYCSKLSLLIRARTYCPSFIDKLDNNSDILPLVENKVINLRDRSVRDRTREDYCSFICPVRYDPNAVSPVVDNFLNDITLGDEDFKRFLQCILGLCLTGYTHTQQMYIFYGPGGANGKTTLIEIMREVLGPFFVQAHKEVFLKVDGSRAGNASPYISELRGTRMAVFCEAEVGDKINEGQIKAFTGGDRIKARPMYKSPIEFSPHFKPFMLTNYKPSCSTDEALWRRLIMVLFGCKFVDKTEGLLPHERTKNPRFKEEFMGNSVAMSAFFNWLVEGANRMYTGALILPQCVLDATNEYKLEQDIYTRFVNDRLQHNPDPKSAYKIAAKELYEEFADWCREDEGIIPKDKNTFGTNIRKVIGEPRRNNRGLFYHGYRLPHANNKVTVHMDGDHSQLTSQLGGRINSNLIHLTHPPGTVCI